MPSDAPETNGRNSDAQDLSVHCAAALILAGVGAWVGSAAYARVSRSRGSRGRSVTTHDESKGSACGGVCRPYLRLSLNGSRGVRSVDRSAYYTAAP